MIRVYFNSGTTNTRAYLLRGDRIADSAVRAVGSRDAALAGDRSVLVRALAEMYRALLEKNGLSGQDVAELWMSGMISCPSGMVEIEHLPLPVDEAALAGAVTEYFEPDFFGRSVLIVPGLKTMPRGIRAPLDRVAEVNNVRGEEIEVFGVLRKHPALRCGRVIVLLPGSHTQALFLTDGVIDGILSNVTGELYGAVRAHSIIGASVEGDGLTPLEPEQVLQGLRNVRKYGFNRALYIVRAMELFSDSTLAQRRSCLEGVLNAGVMQGIAASVHQTSARIAVAGSYAQYEIFSAMGEEFPQFHISLAEEDAGEPFSVAGMLALSERRAAGR